MVNPSRARRFGAMVMAAMTAIVLSGLCASVSSAATGIVVAPTLAGGTVESQTLTSSTGTWTGTGTITYAYRWQRCNADSSACADISGAVANVYTLGSADVGNTVRSVVTATDSGGPPGTDAASATTTAITALAAAAPASTMPPTITGTPTSGQILTAVEGLFAGAVPVTYTYQWQRCDANGATCVAVPAGVTKTFTLARADVGATLRVSVTATNASGSGAATSVPTAVIAEGLPASLIKLADGSFSVAAADVKGKQRLIISSVKTTLKQPIRSRAPFTVTVRVTDTRGYVVRNALVYLQGLPYNRILRTPEHKTLQNGTATFTVVATRLQPLKVGARVVIFARARVEGDALLTGASSRRLVEIVFGPPRT